MPSSIIQNYFNDCDNLINNWMSPITNRSLLSSDPFLSNSPVLSGSPYYDAMPEPFLGDPDNNLAVIVDLNPGFTDANNKYGVPPDNIVLSNSVMTPILSSKGGYSQYAIPFPHLCPNPHHIAAAGWWRIREKWLSKIARMNGYVNTYSRCQDGFDIPDCKPFAIELCPWHSKKWEDSGIKQYTPNQINWINNQVLKTAEEAVKGSKVKFIIGLGNSVGKAAKQLGFVVQKMWKSQNDCSHSGCWPVKDNGKEIAKTFVYLKKDDIRLLNISAMYQVPPAAHFDNLLSKEIIPYINTH